MHNALDGCQEVNELCVLWQEAALGDLDQLNEREKQDEIVTAGRASTAKCQP